MDIELFELLTSGNITQERFDAMPLILKLLLLENIEELCKAEKLRMWHRWEIGLEL